MTLLASPPLAPPDQRLLTGRDMLCFSNDWSGDPLSKMHLMRLLARENRILWINSIGYRSPRLCRYDLGRAYRKLAAATTTPLQEVEPNVFVLNPLALPLYGRFGRSFNRWFLRLQVRRAMRRLGFQRPINWVFNPAAAVVAGEFDEDMLIYYCVDEHAAFSGVSSQSLGELENQLLRKADAVIVSASKLYAPRAAVNPQTVLVRHGVDYDHFRKALDPETVVPEEIARLPRPILGYFGLMATDWLDVDLLTRVARHFAHGSLVLLGKVTMDLSALSALPNVHLLGRKPFASLPAYSKGFDVALVPFPVNEVTLNANPLKAREYLAAGLPVVSTPIPEVSVLRQCRTAADPDGFIREIEAALAQPGPSAERSATMRRETWADRLEEIEGHLTRLLASKNTKTDSE